MAGRRYPGMGEGPKSRIEPMNRVIGGRYGDIPMKGNLGDVERLVLSLLDVVDGREAALKDSVEFYTSPDVDARLSRVP